MTTGSAISAFDTNRKLRQFSVNEIVFVQNDCVRIVTNLRRYRDEDNTCFDVLNESARQ